MMKYNAIEMEEYDPDFNDLDSKFYGLDHELDSKMKTYIQSHAEAFYFDGGVNIPQ